MLEEFLVGGGGSTSFSGIIGVRVGGKVMGDKVESILQVVITCNCYFKLHDYFVF